MAAMNVRSTYALDSDTAKTIKTLALRWETSQAEVVRRSVKLASEQAAAESTPMTPADVIAHYRKNPPSRSWPQTQKLIAAQRKYRDDDDAKRSNEQWGKG
jgi:hypothetical protein